MLPRIHGEFTVGSDVTLKYAQTGTAVASFSAVASKDKKNAAGEWEKDKEIWIRVTTFKQVAEHVAASVTKGSRVVIDGTISVSNYETKEGEKRQGVEVIADEIGVSLRFGTAEYKKAERASGGAPAAAKADTSPWDQPSGNEPPF